MRKELLIAIVVGLLFGLIIGFGIWRANAAINNDPIATMSANNETQTTPTQVENTETTRTNAVTVTTPQDLDVVSQSPIKVAGLAAANSNVVISAEEKDYIIKTDGTGVFETEIEIKNGVNQIIIQDDSLTKEPTYLTVIFSDDFKSQ